MANTYDADLVIDRLAEASILVLQKKLPALNAFSRDFGADVLKPRATVQVEKSGTGATAQSNPTNYETGNVTNSNVAVTVAEKTVSFSVASQELMSGHKLNTKAEQQLRGLANAVWAVPEALLDESVYTNAVVVATEAAIDADDLATGWASIGDSIDKHCVLSHAAYSRFNAQNKDQFNHEGGAYNFDTFDNCSQWSNAQDANTRGFFCGPNAMAVASGIPLVDPVVANQMEASRVVEIPDLGLSVVINLWGSTATRTLWASYGVMFGAAVADASALTLYQTS